MRVEYSNAPWLNANALMGRRGEVSEDVRARGGRLAKLPLGYRVRRLNPGGVITVLLVFVEAGANMKSEEVEIQGRGLRLLLRAASWARTLSVLRSMANVANRTFSKTP